ncbi:BTAD domain-containing putative transcriptional regulator, partial [Armatimonas sp.]|uniref:ATP-binding protein n=1 Tax=Armatimonas sp. TaxID=1872638 RepID=UPI00286C57CC
MDLTLRLFGGMELLANGDSLPPGPRHLAGERLLALLALHGPQSRARLAATLWPEVTESQGRFYLRRTLMEVRLRLGEAAGALVETSGTSGVLTLQLPVVACDLWAFDQALQDCDDARAVALYRGTLLPDWDADWIQTERMQREQEFLGALERLARLAETSQEAIITLKRLTTLDPARESAWCALMEAQAKRGNPAALMQTYRALRLWLSENLRTVPAPETTALYERLLAEARHSPTPKVAFPKRSRLPLAPTALVGRQAALEQLRARLGETRLLTLVGIGGVGKTRLALATLESLQDDPRFSDGIAWVDLAALSDPSLVRARIATALELSETADLATLLANRKLLLALDNCEHLLDAIADEVDALLTACPSLFFLTTSREPLGLSSETIWRVSALAEDESFQLFQARAQKALPGWQLTEQNRPLVRQLCQRLDDLPFAIELAAARLGSLPLSELVRRLDARFDLLTGGSRTVLRRQQTLRAAMDWSWELLTGDEQTALRQLAIFISPFPLETGEVACPDGLTQLPSLVAKSLIAFSPENGSYRLLETVREYVMEQELGEAGRAARQRYLWYVLNQAQQAVAEYFGPNRHHWHQVLEAAHDNIRLALSDAVQSHPELALELAGNLWLFWREQGYRLEGLRTLRQLLESSAVFPETLQGRAWLGTGVLAYETADYDLTYRALDEALRLARLHQDGWAEGEALRVLGLAHWNQGRPDQARDLYLQSQECFVRC